ncbi:hypothetical protein MPDQ_004166 [Monascus purpureus]|uniref:OTU domain-containing protein n=1 Tax=Monascus purpureus TaxID=5098 RepID=A0A507QHQ1_MONPU|nr:hypothetical protein MPDQ_004166 [Monascus purpureus]BDD55553.1 hypothetical protein MAP00_001056 [Monascus purpureus]
MDELLVRHRKEQKDLQARITQKKKAATRKTRKGVNDECERLQRDLDEKHKAEIVKLNGESAPPIDGLGELSLEDGVTNGVTDKVNGENDAHTTSPASAPSQTTPAHRSKKPNRHKARLARRAAEQAAIAAAAAEEAATQIDRRGNEQEVMNAVFKRLGLREVEVNPDGHCLYSAVATQLDELGIGLKPDPSRMILQYTTQARVDTVTEPRLDGYRAVRAVVADYILEHKDDFAPFLAESLYEYTRRIKLTADWGGQLELIAISRAYGVEINVIQNDGRIEKIEPGDGPEADAEGHRRVLWLAYFRHTYGLGEHYNALLKEK